MSYSAENPKFAYTDDLHRLNGVPFEGMLPEDVQISIYERLSQVVSEHLSMPENEHDREVIRRKCPASKSKSSA